MQQVITRHPIWSIFGIFIVVILVFLVGAFILFGTIVPFSSDIALPPPDKGNISPKVMAEIERARVVLNEQVSIYRNANNQSIFLAALGAGIATVVGIATAAIKSDNNAAVKLILLIAAIVGAGITGYGTYQGQIAKNALEGATEIETVVNTVLDDIEKDPSAQDIRHIFKLQKVTGKYSTVNVSLNTSTVEALTL